MKESERAKPKNIRPGSGLRAAPAVVIGEFRGRDLIVQLIIDPIWRHPALFVLGSLSCLMVVLIAVQIRSADLVGGLTSAITSYMAIVAALLTTPTKFVQNLLSLTGESADREAASGIGFYILNYSGSVVLFYSLTKSRDTTWLLKWLIAGGVFGLGVICGSSVVLRLATQAAGLDLETSSLIALKGYEAGLLVLIWTVGFLTLLGITKSCDPALFEVYRESNYAPFPAGTRFGKLQYVLVVCTLLVIFGASGFYAVAINILATDTIIFMLVDGLLLLVSYFIKRLFDDRSSGLSKLGDGTNSV